jgi:magnesium chelatase accessory protein
MASKLDWNRDGADWPNRAASRFVTAAGFGWHVQMMGSGPVLLMLHGTGAATHSWRGVMAELARHFTVIAPDLPGHGFTQTPPSSQMSLPGMSRAVGQLLRVLEVTPDIAVGHSAGAAILARMCLDGLIAPKAVISLNGAMLPLANMPNELFAPLARMMAAVPLVSHIAARQAGSPKALGRLLRGTGSVIEPEGVAFYARLVSNPGHVAGALSMMANWNLRELARDLPRLTVPLTLVAASGDLTIPPADATRIRRLVPGARLVSMPGLGHLAHEEQPGQAVAIILDAARVAEPSCAG